MNQSRLRAPSTDGGLLAIPPLREASRLLAENGSSLASWDYDVQGRSATSIRTRARQEILERSQRFMDRHGLEHPDLATLGGAPEDGEHPWVVTGHQPELFHPGVWVKNFATGAIARRSNGIALNLIVDNDLPKSATIAVPSEGPQGIRKTAVEFDTWPDGEVPFEDRNVVDEERFASFPTRVHEILGDIVEDPLIDEFWPLALATRGEVSNAGLRFAIARHQIESSWGTRNFEVPLSEVCETDAFYWFTSHLLAQLPRFQEIHNRALGEYRRLYGIRSRNHPVADLATVGEWREAPFWVWRAERPRRQPLLARQVGRRMELRISGESEILLDLPLAPDREACCAVEALRELPGRSVRLRTRALTTTLFCRYFLGDLFLHGIGGAKYDELGDAIARRFLGIDPPPFLTLSQTIRLGLPSDPTLPAQLVDVRRQLRDAEFNPERVMGEPLPPEVRSIVEAKRQAISGPKETHRQRKARRSEIRRLNESLQPFVESKRRSLKDRNHEVQHGLMQNRIATNREYSLVLHSRKRLRDAMLSLDSEPGPL
jgi:hypothetical protein